jgi:NAD(P)-dependent dehydrogenase (short-subunit alcohol dehydrogenase family)
MHEGDLRAGALAPLLTRSQASHVPLNKPVALVTGANRGIGLEVARQFAARGVLPVLGARNAERGVTAVDGLRAAGLQAVAVRLDVTCDHDVADAVDAVLTHFGRLDIVVNNAAMFPESREGRVSHAAGACGRTLLELLDVNAVGAYRVAAAALPVMLRQGFGRIINVSSDMASTSELQAVGPPPGGFCVGYRMSKTALNVMTQVLATEVQGTGIRVNAVSPGQVRTDMGRLDADRSVSEGADSIVWLALLGEDGPNGALVRDRQVVPW